jgi:hypothetical protein
MRHLTLPVPAIRAPAVGALALAGALWVGALQAQAASPPTSNPRGSATAQATADFEARVEAYAHLHKKLEATLPRLPKGATPQQIDSDQRALEQLIVQARPDAKVGDVFTPAMQTLVRALLADEFKGPHGAVEVKETGHDQAPPVKVINKRYPDDVPLSGMPPKCWRGSKLPNELSTGSSTTISFSWMSTRTSSWTT